MTPARLAWPGALRINAWNGGPVTGELGQQVRDGDWALALAQSIPAVPVLAAPELSNLRDWRDKDVGWGVILPESDRPAAEKAVAADALEPVRRLVEARAGVHGPVVFRHRDGDFSSVYRYLRDGRVLPVAVSGSDPGTGSGRLPHYLLIVGSPAVIPWDLQFQLNVGRAVGRLDLPEEALARYIDALLTDWHDSAVQATDPVVWTTEHSVDDITWLMRHAIAEPVSKLLREDRQIGDRVRHLAGEQATAARLRDALAETPPGYVLTTSHGMTGPVSDPDAMRRDLGLLVDAAHNLVRPEDLLAAWQPDGVVWYAHACCSAGSNATTRFRGLVEPRSAVEQVLEAIAGLGPIASPFPTALLSAAKPARVFIGHVEPTFDWTIQRPETDQPLTGALREALYTRLHLALPDPVGLAFQRYLTETGSFFAEAARAVRDIGHFEEAAPERATIALLTAYDRQSTVILGDPTVCPTALPPLLIRRATDSSSGSLACV
ncbi:MAG: hypothetical protein ACRDYA_17600 [Egibacteraceae bacterium]